MNSTLVCVPYDSALRNVRMGAGPEHLIKAGLADRVEGLGYSTQTETVEDATSPPAEIRTGFALMRGVAAKVGQAVTSDRFPVVLSGNCNAAIGTYSGLGEDVGVVWFDAHGDFNTPATTTSGFLDGTGVATLTGRCWQSIAATVPGFTPADEANVVLAGARDFDPAERTALEASDVTIIRPSALQNGTQLQTVVDELAKRVRGIYLHIDPDVVDSSYGRANSFAGSGGISPMTLRNAVEEIGRRSPILGMGVASYDPAADGNGAIREVVLDVITTAIKVRRQ